MGFPARLLSLPWWIVVFSACGPDRMGRGERGGPIDDQPPLSDLAPLLEGWPGNDKLPDEGKADARYPVKFDAPMQWQSPVRNQASRGVCSIFSALGLMEHLYIKEGTIDAPDFSEQFLQWSVKVELGAFTDTEGSSSSHNLSALNRFGVVEERYAPYQTTSWGLSNDPECDGEDEPVQCHTNGDPPESALSAQRFHLPPGRWISSRADSIKAHMVANEEAVVVGGAFYYQSWNHGASKLTTNRDYFTKGYVTFPSAEDIADSEARPAGHSFVLVGWDDELSVQKRDGAGNLLVDESGQPDMETGFFLFRNSWGTGSFGTQNPYGAGYGWISYEYVEEYLTAYVSDTPNLDFTEDCADDADNDYDQAIDCDDEDCVGDAACALGSTEIHSFGRSTPIPDGDPTGVELDLDVRQEGSITSFAVTVDLTHPYIGDLQLVLMRDGRDEVVLHDYTGGGSDDIKRTWSIPDFVGQDADAVYTLRVVDAQKTDVGVVNNWSVEIKTGAAGSTTTDTYRADQDVAIPDGDPIGAFSNLQVDDRGTIQAMKAIVEIDHPYKGDLTVKLQRIGQPGEAVLVEADASSGSFGTRSFVVPDFVGEDGEGTWRLVVIDEAKNDVGTLRCWSLEITH